MAKIYTNPNMAIDTSSDFGPDEIVDMIGKFEQMSANRAAGKRADAQLAIQESNQQYLENTRAETEALKEALRKFSHYGIDHEATGNFNPAEAFKKDYNYDRDFDTAWKAASSTNPQLDRTTFENAWGANYLANLNRAGRRYRAMRDVEKSNTGITDDNVLNRYMQDKYGGKSLYTQLQVLGQDATTIMGYSPVGDPVSWKDTAKKLFMKDRFTDEETGKTYGGGLTGIGAASMFALPGAVPTYGLYKAFGRKGGQFKVAKDAYLKEALANEAQYKQTYKKDKDGKLIKDKAGKKIPTGTAPGSGLSGGEKGDFKKQYGMLKSEAFKKGKPTDKFIKAANKLARSQTALGKQLSFGKSYGLSAMGGGMGSKAAEYAAEKLGGGEKTRIAASLGGGVGGAVGGHKLMKRLMQPETMKKLAPLLKKHAPKVAAKLGLSATGLVVPEPVSSALGAAGLAWVAYDVYKLAKEIPAIADVIFSEE
jgi:hypothetical protein